MCHISIHQESLSTRTSQWDRKPSVPSANMEVCGLHRGQPSGCDGDTLSSRLRAVMSSIYGSIWSDYIFLNVFQGLGWGWWSRISLCPCVSPQGASPLWSMDGAASLGQRPPVDLVLFSSQDVSRNTSSSSLWNISEQRVSGWTGSLRIPNRRRIKL